VITRDTKGTQLPSLVSASNSLQVAVAEYPGRLRPVLQISSADPSRNPGCCLISGGHNLPLWLRLHGSGGRTVSVGDLQAYWGDTTMGHQDGIQSIFSIYEDRTGDAIAKGGERQLIMAPQDAVWSLNGNFGSETFWYGYKDIPFSSASDQSHIYPYTKAKLSFIVPWSIRNYGADPNRIYGISESMGAYGEIQWALRQPGLFAAIFMRVPILGAWNRIPSLIDLIKNGAPKTVLTATDTLPDGHVTYNDDTDVAKWLAADCSRELPYVSWSSGRRDVGLGNHRMWSYAVTLADTLKSCRYGFSFIWNNGVHDGITAGLERSLLVQYHRAFAKNVSYPAFTSFSLDSNYGSGSPDSGDPTGCVNCGWTWNVTEDTSSSWSASFTNAQATQHATTNVTPRNTQHFKCSPGTYVKWFTSTGQDGKVLVDSYGLVTVTGVKLNVGAPIVLTLDLQNDAR
jgi:hypothetical protein